MHEAENHDKKRSGSDKKLWKILSTLFLLLLIAVITLLEGCTEGSQALDLFERVGRRVLRKEESRTRRRKHKLYLVQPVILSFSPMAGPITGGTVIDVHGFNFFNVPTVKVGFTDAIRLGGNSTYFQIITVPHPAGIADIKVVNANTRTATRRAAFLFYSGSPPPPTITAVDPPLVPWGYGVTVAVNGLAFREGAKVYFNDVESDDVFVESCTRVKARTPFAGVGPVTVAVVNPDGGCASVSTMFEYADWSSESIAGNVLTRRQYRYAEDRAAGLLVAFGGYQKGYISGYADVNMTWTFDGTDYQHDIVGDEPLPGRFDFAFAPNPGGGAMMFGGFGDGGDLADTWVYSGAQWQLEAPAVSPTLRAYASAAFDSGSGKTILFGGSFGLKFLNDTWSWDGSTWQRIATTDAPSPRRRFALAEDEALGGLVLFGGDTVTGLSRETWTFDGSDWAFVTNTGPSPRVDAALAFDCNTGKILLFGGANHTTAFADTWLYDPVTATWTEAAPGVSPSARLDAAIATDHVRNRVVMHGGFRRQGNDVVFENDTWEWDGAIWIHVTPQLGP